MLIFVRTDCPLTNRYAPELRRISEEFNGKGVSFWLVYPDRSETKQGIERHVAQYGFPGQSIRDLDGSLVARAHATVAPEAAVFDKKGQLVYHGRIDDQWVDFGKSRPAASVHDLEMAISDVVSGKRVTVSETRAIGCAIADVQ